MFSTKLTLTFFTYIIIALTLASSTNASIDYQQIQRRDHANLKRMVQKRIPLPQDATANTAADPNANGGSDLVNNGGGIGGIVSTTTASTTSTSAASSTTGSSTTTGTSTTGSSSASSTTSSASGSGSASGSSTASTTTSGSGSASATTTTPAQASTTPAKNTSATTPNFLSASGAAAATGSPQSDTSNNSTSSAKVPVTILIVIGASIVGAGVIWTIIRKWKFRPSSDFDARMQPIDWNPSNADDDASGIPGSHRRHSGASFNSGMERSANDNHGLPLPPLPDHDFTAGATNVGGYADLARGGQPQMQEMYGANMYGQYPQHSYPQHDAYGGHY